MLQATYINIRDLVKLFLRFPNCITQYETNYRVPKRDLLTKIAEALNVSRQNFYTEVPDCTEDFMRTFFWLDGVSLGSICLFQLVHIPVQWRKKNGASKPPC